ncbi:MAG: hypothetical protein IKN04_16235 [Clostridia bacterium]|nr:hypothetical protein [Clostridia bacterium]
MKKMEETPIICFPTMLGAILFTSVVTIPRQNLGKIMGQDLLGYYATVATPSVFVQVMVNSLMSPSISEVSVARENRDKKKFWGITARMNLIILCVGGIAIVGVVLLGRPIMTLLYGEKIFPYISPMYAVIGCTVLYAVCSVCFNLLIALQKMTA